MVFIKKYYKYLIALLFLFLLLAGTLGYYHYNFLNGGDKTFIDCIFLSMQLFALKFTDLGAEVPFYIYIFRFILPLATLVGFYLSFEKPINQSFEGLYQHLTVFSIKRMENHVIVCGLSKRSEFLLNDMLKKNSGNQNHQIVLIEKNSKHENLDRLVLQGVKVLIGSALDEKTLKKANIFNARAIITLTENDEINTEIAKKLTDIFKEYYKKKKYNSKKQLNAIIHLDDHFMLQTFKDYHEVRIPELATPISAIDFHATNIFKKAAQSIVDRNSPDQIKAIQPNDPAVEILILGLAGIGEHILIEATYIYHFLNLKKLKVYVVDNEVEKKVNKLLNFIPDLSNLIDMVIIEQTTFFQSTKDFELDKISVCFVAKETDGECIFYAKKLRQMFIKLNNNSTFPRISVALPKNTKLLTLLDGVKSDAINDILGIEYFSIYENICSYKEIIEGVYEIDNIAKQINAAYTLNENPSVTNQELEESWLNLNDGMKDSNRLGARHLNYKLRFVGAEMIDKEVFIQGGRTEFRFDDIPENILELIKVTEHQRWMYEKYLNGYQPCKDLGDRQKQNIYKNKLKLHKDMIDYNALDKHSKDKDLSAFSEAKNIADRINKVIVKL